MEGCGFIRAQQECNLVIIVIATIHILMYSNVPAAQKSSYDNNILWVYLFFVALFPLLKQQVNEDTA